MTRDKKKVDRPELKTGPNVVVDARGDSLKNLQVLEVRLVPKPSGKCVWPRAWIAFEATG